MLDFPFFESFDLENNKRLLVLSLAGILMSCEKTIVRSNGDEIVYNTLFTIYSYGNILGEAMEGGGGGGFV